MLPSLLQVWSRRLSWRRCRTSTLRNRVQQSSRQRLPAFRNPWPPGKLFNCFVIEHNGPKNSTFYSSVRHVYLASGYANQHAMSQTPNLEIGRVAAGSAPGGKYLGAWMSALILYRRRRFINHLLTYSRSRPCGCCRPASGHTVRGVSERGPSTAINRRPHQIQNYW